MRTLCGAHAQKAGFTSQLVSQGYTHPTMWTTPREVLELLPQLIPCVPTAKTASEASATATGRSQNIEISLPTRDISLPTRWSVFPIIRVPSFRVLSRVGTGERGGVASAWRDDTGDARGETGVGSPACAHCLLTSDEGQLKLVEPEQGDWWRIGVGYRKAADGRGEVDRVRSPSLLAEGGICTCNGGVGERPLSE